MSHHILVVDDEPSILQAIKRLLRRDGYEIHLAENGRAALEIVANTEVAVIVCDQRMPEMIGSEVLAEAARIRPDAYRITLTGHADLTAAQALINEASINQFLLKPWDDDALRRIIQEGVRSYDLIRENRRLDALTRKQKLKLEVWNKHLERQVQQRTAELRTQNESLIRLQRRIEQSLRDTVGLLAGMLESHSPSLGIHSKRVAQLAREVGCHLELPDDELRDVEFAAHLHDIGKIASIHRDDTPRPRRLARDRSAIARHPESGYAIISHVGGFERIARGVRHQEELYEGGGCPHGLRGEKIPLASRIIAIADAYDRAVFNSTNPMKVSRDAGRQALLDGKNSRFDPLIVRLVLDCVVRVDSVTSCDAEVQLSPQQLKPDMVLARAINNHDDVLLLKEGTILTSAFIERIRALSDVDPLLTNVFVYCNRAGGLAGDNDAPVHTGTTAANSSNSECKSPAVDADCKKEVPAAQSNEGPDSPCSAPAAPQPSTRHAPTPPPEANAGKRVLIVDDSRLVRKALYRELRRAGFESVSASDGLAAIDLAKKGGIDVALTDLAMPNMSGEELVRHLGQCAPGLPCIIITGKATMEEVKRLFEEPNVAGILVKPWDHQRLIDTIAAALAESHSERVREMV